ncbi:MAG: TlpA disulfide reductase family protein [Bacteroidota bacterium]
MKNAYLITLVVLFSNLLCAQEYLTSDTSCISHYTALSNEAFNRGDEAYLAYMYDSVKVCLVGRTIQNTILKTVNENLLHTDSIRENILLIFSASWCAPCIANIPAINRLAGDQHHNLKIVVIYWDTYEKVKEISAEYAAGVVLVPSIEANGAETSMTYGNISHQLGYPTSYVIDTKKEIIDLVLGGTVSGDLGNGITITEEEATQKNYAHLIRLLSQLE